MRSAVEVQTLDNRMRTSPCAAGKGSHMESRAKSPEWRAVESEVHPGRWVLEQNVGGIWKDLTANIVVQAALYTEQDAKLLAGAPVLLTQLVGLNLMLDRMRTTMLKATSMRQIRDTAADAALQALVNEAIKTIGDLGGPKTPADLPDLPKALAIAKAALQEVNDIACRQDGGRSGPEPEPPEPANRDGAELAHVARAALASIEACGR